MAQDQQWHNIELIDQVSIWPFPINGTESLFYGFLNKPLIIKEFISKDNLSEHRNNLIRLGDIPNVAKPIILRDYEPPHFLGTRLCLDAPYQPILNFFEGKRDEFRRVVRNGRGFYRFIKTAYEQVFKGMISGLRTLLKRGFVVRNLRHTTMIAPCGPDLPNDQVYYPLFVDIVRRADQNSEEGKAQLLQMLKDLRDIMREVVSLSGMQYDDERQKTRHGVPEALFDSLTNSRDLYLEKVGCSDPDYVLNDAWIWSSEHSVVRRRNMLTLFKDNPLDDQLKPYFLNFPADWQQGLKRGSFFDKAISNQNKKVAIRNANIDLATKIIEREEEKQRYGGGRPENMNEIMEAYKAKLESASRRRGWDSYETSKGPLCVLQSERNGELHHNENASEMKETLKTVDQIVEFVDNEFKFSCSRLFWFFNDLWTDDIVLEWVYHKDMLKGEKSSQDEFDKESTKQRMKKEKEVKEKEIMEKEEALKAKRRREDEERRRVYEETKRQRIEEFKRLEQLVLKKRRGSNAGRT